MGRKTGLHRVATVIRWLGVAFAGLVFLLMLPQGTRELGEVAITAGVSGAIYAAFHGLAWIVDGFAAHD